MSELFVELFSEEIPARLQINARNELKKNIKNFFVENQIKFNENLNVYSTPNRLVLHVDKIPNEIRLSSEEIKGPNVNAPEKALEGFIKSNNTRHNIFGLWSIKLLDRLEKDLNDGERKVELWANNVGVKIINMEFPNNDPFFNINTKGDLEKAKEILK